MGLTSQQVWGLCNRTYDALVKEWDRNRDDQMKLVAALRADLHNTSSRNFKRHYKADDFMPGASHQSIEERARELMAMGYAPAAAAAIASSKHSKEHNLYVLNKQLSQAQRAAEHPKRGRSAPRKTVVKKAG